MIVITPPYYRQGPKEDKSSHTCVASKTGCGFSREITVAKIAPIQRKVSLKFPGHVELFDLFAHNMRKNESILYHDCSHISTFGYLEFMPMLLALTSL